MIAQVGSDGAYKALDTNFTGANVTIAAAPSKNIEFKSVSVSDHNLFGLRADYTFEFFLGGSSLDVDENLHAMFPK